MKQFSKDEAQRFWATRNGEDSTGNKPDEYLLKDTKIVDWMINFWSPLVNKGDAILEMGCNAGANLNHLYNKGYKNVWGIEINPYAVNLLSDKFPHIKHNIFLGSLEDKLPIIPKTDVSFSMAVLSHVHPDSIEIVAHEMVRTTLKYIVVIEWEDHETERLYQRNYSKLFINAGCEEINAGVPIYQGVSNEYYGCIAKMFKVIK